MIATAPAATRSTSAACSTTDTPVSSSSDGPITTSRPRSAATDMPILCSEHSTRVNFGVTPRPRGSTRATLVPMQLDASNLERFARGCAVLGTGGGGDTYAMVLGALQAVGDHGP